MRTLPYVPTQAGATLRQHWRRVWGLVRKHGADAAHTVHVVSLHGGLRHDVLIEGAGMDRPWWVESDYTRRDAEGWAAMARWLLRVARESIEKRRAS